MKGFGAAAGDGDILRHQSLAPTQSPAANLIAQVPITPGLGVDVVGLPFHPCHAGKKAVEAPGRQQFGRGDGTA